jgi:leukotriene-A4 hydrolase
MCLSHSAPKDPSSLANLKQVKSTHLHLDWTISFDNKNITGNVLLDLETLEDNVDKVILDSSYLAIRRVSLNKQDLKVSCHQKAEVAKKRLNH